MVLAQTENGKAGDFYFAFREGSDVYEYDYQGNDLAFKQLGDCVESFGLTDNQWHLRMEVFAKEGGEANLPMLNQRIFRAAILRSQLHTGLNIPYDRVAFYISSEDHWSDKIRITFVKQPISIQANTDIFYSLSSLPADISRALSRYRQLPFSDWGDWADYPEESVDKPEKTVEVVQNTVEGQWVYREPDREPIATPSPAPVREPARKSAPEPAQRVLPPVTKGKLPPGAYPFNLGLKTNLLPWMGVVSVWGLGGEGGDKNTGYSHGAPMYNGALEYYFADRYSLEASFLYAYSPYGGKKDNLWGISIFSLEPRFWIDPDNSFRKFHIGMRAEYGDFDMKKNQPVNYGKTGRFYSVAFTVGYTLPIYRNFLVEGGLSLGYRNMYDGKNYRYDPAEKKNFYEEGFSEGTFVIGLSVSLLYRLGFW